MPVKVFILGLPGSGKSTACRIVRDHILQHTKIMHITHLSDYDILWEMFLDDLRVNPPALRRFEPTKEHAGFNVRPHAYAAFDEALWRINEKMKIWQLAQPEQWFLLEFSRNDYQKAFRMFDASLLRDAHFLFIEAHRTLCRRRLHARVQHPQTEDDHFVSNYILDTYYKKTAPLHVAHFRDEYRLAAQQIDIIQNNASLEQFALKVRLFASRTLRAQKDLSLSGRPPR